MIKIDNIAELKQRKGISNSNISLLGYYSVGDGGGGEFYWDSTSTETDNGGTIIQVTGVITGRWKRVFYGSLNMKWFGAKGDNTQDDTIFIQNAINYAKGRILYVPNGIYKITNQIQLNYSTTFSSHLEGTKIIGESEKEVIFNSFQTSGSLFNNEITTSQASAAKFYYNLQLKNITLQGAGSTNTNGIVTVGCFNQSIENVTIFGFDGYGYFVDKRDDLEFPTGNPDSYATQCYFTRVTIQGCGEWGINFIPYGNIPILDMCVIADNAKGGIRLTSTNCTIRNCIIGFNGVGGGTNAAGILIEYNAENSQTVHNNHIHQCELDNNYNYNIWIKSGIKNTITNCRFLTKENSGDYTIVNHVRLGGDAYGSTINNIINCYYRYSHSTLPIGTKYANYLDTSATNNLIETPYYDYGGNTNILPVNSVGIRNKVTDYLGRDSFENRPYSKNITLGVSLTSAITATTGVNTDIVFNNILYNDFSSYNLSTGEFEANNVAGFYLITGIVNITGNISVNTISFQLRLNAASSPQIINVPIKSFNGSQSFNFHFLQQVFQSDKLKLRITHSNPTDITIDTSSRMSVVKIA